MFWGWHWMWSIYHWVSETTLNFFFLIVQNLRKNFKNDIENSCIPSTQCHILSLMLCMFLLSFSLSHFSWAFWEYVEHISKSSLLLSTCFVFPEKRGIVFFYSHSAVTELRRLITDLLLAAIHFTVSSSVPVMSFIQLFFPSGDYQVYDHTVYIVVMSLSYLLSVYDSDIFLDHRPVILENFSQLEFEYFLMSRFRLRIWGWNTT